MKNDEPDALEDEHIAVLNTWAHKVHRQKGKSNKKGKILKPKHTTYFDIDDEKQLNDVLNENRKLQTSLPSARNKEMLMTMMSKNPSANLLQEGEVWALIDSGAGVDGLDCAEHVPDATLTDTPEPIRCITASGEEMVVNQMANTNVLLDGQPCTVPSSDLKLDMPILSVRRHIHRGYRCRIREGGGYFRNTKTRAKARFVEREGVYFIRMKVLGQASDKGASLFGRPGTAP